MRTGRLRCAIFLNVASPQRRAFAKSGAGRDDVRRSDASEQPDASLAAAAGQMLKTGDSWWMPSSHAAVLVEHVELCPRLLLDPLAAVSC